MVRLSGSWQQVREGILELQRRSLQATRRQSKLYSGAMLCGAGVLVFYVLVSFSSIIDFPPVFDPRRPLLIAWVSCMVFCPVQFLLGRLVSRGILDEEKLSAAMTLLNTLEPDGDRKAKVRLQLDLRAVKSCPDKVKAATYQPGVKWGPWKPYRQRWLRLRTRLALGRQLDLQLVRKYRHKLYPKRSSCREKQVCVDMMWLNPPGDVPPPPQYFSQGPRPGVWQRRGDSQENLAQFAPQVIAGLIWHYLHQEPQSQCNSPLGQAASFPTAPSG